jgi:hypothetical protein
MLPIAPWDLSTKRRAIMRLILTGRPFSELARATGSPERSSVLNRARRASSDEQMV